MLQGVKAEGDEVRRVMRAEDAENAAFLPQFVVVEWSGVVGKRRIGHAVPQGGFGRAAYTAQPLRCHPLGALMKAHKAAATMPDRRRALSIRPSVDQCASAAIQALPSGPAHGSQQPNLR